MAEMFNSETAQTQNNAPVGYTITLRGREVTKKQVSNAIDIETLKRFTREAGISQFSVHSDDGTDLTSGDFPYNGNVVVREYNAAKSE